MLNLLKRLLGRVEQATNTARRHPNKHVQDENMIRARCYQTAYDDAHADEELRAMDRLCTVILERWYNDRLQGMSADEYVQLRPYLVEVDKFRDAKYLSEEGKRMREKKP